MVSFSVIIYSKGGRSGSDLTIADFWGIGQLNLDLDDDQGTSLVLVYTDKGAATLSALHINVWQAQYEDILRFNPAVEQSKPEHPKRKWFFGHLDTTDSVVSLIDRTLRVSFLARIKTALKNLIRKVYHSIVKMGGVILAYKNKQL